MRCRNIQKKLSAYQDKELRPGEQEEISRHLLNCRSCREQYERLEQTWQALGELEGIRPDPWFYPQLVRRIGEPREQGLLATLQHVFHLLCAPAIASVLLAVGIVVGVYFGNVMVQSDFLPFRQTPAGYSQEAFLDSLRVFDAAPPGTLAHGYMQVVGNKGDESK